jgi:acyl carrier protein
MDLSGLRNEIKELIVSELDLRGRSAADIVDDAPLFGGGLALDSLDALQLAMVVEERFGVTVPEGEASRAVFASVQALAEFIDAARRK